MHTKKVIIFDFDGTLVDSLQSIINVFNTHASSFGLQKMTAKDIELMRNMSYLDIIYKYKVPLLQIPFIIHKVRKEMYDKMDRIILFPGIHKVLNELKSRNFTIGILTSNNEENVRKFLKSQKIHNFDFIHSESNLFGKGKVLKRLIEDKHLKPQEVIYVGDEVRDIEACKQVGVDIVSVTYGFNKREILEKHNPTYLVNSPDEILQLLK